MEDSTDQRQQRIQKLDALKKLGVRPYGTRFEVTHQIEPILSTYGGNTKEQLEETQVACRIAGRIVALRRFGKAAFAALQDGAHRLQVYLKKDILGERGFTLSQELDLGDWIGVEGSLFRTKTNELTVEARGLTFLSKGLRPLPEKWHGLTDIETRYRQRYVDLIVNDGVAEVFIARSRATYASQNSTVSKGWVSMICGNPMWGPDC